MLSIKQINKALKHWPGFPSHPSPAAFTVKSVWHLHVPSHIACAVTQSPTPVPMQLPPNAVVTVHNV